MQKTIRLRKIQHIAEKPQHSWALLHGLGFAAVTPQFETLNVLARAQQVWWHNCEITKPLAIELFCLAFRKTWKTSVHNFRIILFWQQLEKQKWLACKVVGKNGSPVPPGKP